MVEGLLRGSQPYKGAEMSDLNDFIECEDTVKFPCLGIEMSKENYREGDEDGFPFTEAIKKDYGEWRLPTRREWVLICEILGKTDNGELDVRKIKQILNLDRSSYWTSTPAPRFVDTAHSVYVDNDLINDNTWSITRLRYLHVRLVKDIK